MPQAPIDLSQFTPEEQRLIAECFNRIKGLTDPAEQERVIGEMLPPALVQKVMAAMGQQAQPQTAPQGFRP